MTTAQITLTHDVQPLVSRTARAATAIAVVALVSLAWVGVERESHQAVEKTTAALTQRGTMHAATSGVSHVTLPTVEVVGRRDTARKVPVANSGTDATAL